MATRSGKRSASATKKKHPGMEQLQEWVELARYEINVDPYRGLQEVLNGESTVKSPWRLSCVPDLEDSSGPNADKDKEMIDEVETDRNVMDIDSTDDEEEALGLGSKISDRSQEDEALVSSVARCKCPSLLHWTRETAKKTQRKRKNKESSVGVSRRPMESLDYRCACDYNPFCLWSLGGAIEDVLLPDDSSDEVEVVPDWDNPKAEVYSSATQEIYKRVRRSTLMNVASVRDYLDQMVEDVDGAIDRLEALQSSLYFINPLVTPQSKRDQPSTKIRMALPPGIENLGATCYLNTQLQCLAQNRVFVQGILRWQCDANDRMSTVLRLFQNLLARMHFGPYNTVNTLEFSNALGLDHHEQQDPNEFSRLFLERMHQSFQGSDLGNLLPLLFRGENTFETVCHNCKSKSVRKEPFMDLNLPIVQLKLGKQGSVLEFVKPKKKSVDLEQCLSEYGQAEHLNGDNQYHCAQCESKQDAIRYLKLTSLPSVLNFQLVRYVYNRQTCMKKKVTTAVTLPHFTKVGKQRYRLCAIMSHKGASAYSGHYTAEAMDWTSGQWYSFNDEVVRPLPNGPKSSYCGDKDFVECEGSSDAYNLYYVAEDFLTQSILDSVREPLHKLPLAYQMSTERCDLFKQLSEMSSVDARAAEQLTKRRSLIRRQLGSRDVQSLLWPLSEKDMVWVDTTFLIRFFSCLDSIQNVLKHSCFFDVSCLLCKHKRLHPRVARKGKFIPRAMIELIVECIQKEDAKLFKNDESEIGFSQNMIGGYDVMCKECATEYTENLAKKLKRVELMLKLRTALEPCHLSSAFPLASSDSKNLAEAYAYVISRKFATWFRNTVDDFARLSLKDASSAERSACESSLVCTKAESSAEGVDGLEPSRFLNPPHGEEGVSRRVNGPIICKHEQFSAMRKQSYFVVPGTLWNQIKALFPCGVEVRFSNDPHSNQDEVPTIARPFCLACFDDAKTTEDCKGSNDDDSRPKGPPNSAADKQESEVMIVEPPPTTYDLKVFEAIEGSSLDDILGALSMIQGADRKGEDGGFLENFLRRSSRKRKCRFPVGCFVDEETCRVDFSRNIASLRLSLLENCSVGSSFQLDHTLHLVIAKHPKRTSSTEPFQRELSTIATLDYAKNSETLKKVCENTTSVSFDNSFDPSSILTLVRVAERDSSILSDIGKEEIFDHFISLAHGASGQKREKNRTTRVERGFNGTFLLGSSIEFNKQEREETQELSEGEASCERSPELPKRSSAPSCELKTSLCCRGGEDVPLSTSNRKIMNCAKAMTDSPLKRCIDKQEIDDSSIAADEPTQAERQPAIHGPLKHSTMMPSTIVQPRAVDRGLPPLKVEGSSNKSNISEYTGSDARPLRCSTPLSNNLELDGGAVDTTELLDSIVAALTTNPDISDQKQNPPMIRLAAEQALQSNLSDLNKLIESAYQVYLELMTI